MKISNRIALLGSAITAATFLAAAPAQAACTYTGTFGENKICSTPTTTTNSSAYGPTDREFVVTTVNVPITNTVGSGILVDGYGLAVTDTGGSALNSITVTNDGTVQINAGNTATFGGSAALQVTGLNAPINYLGTGNIINLGNSGDGLSISTSGTGAITANVGGSVTSAVGGTAINLQNTGTAGAISVTTTAGQTIRGGSGVIAQIQNAANTGNVTVVNNANVASLVAAPNTLFVGVAGTTAGTGNLNVSNTGTIGSATDRAQFFALYAANSGTAGSVTVTNGAGSIFGVNGVLAQSTASGPISVTTGAGAVNATNLGILVNAGGTANVTTVTTGTGAVTASDPGGVGILVSGAANAAATTVTTGGTVTGGTTGIQVATVGVQTITANGVTTGTTGSGIHSDTTAARTINVGAAGNVTGATQSILLANTGGAAVNNSGIIGAAATGLAINAATATAPVTVTNNTGATINGRMTLGAGADVVTNAGTINTQGITDFGAGADVFTNSGTYNTTAATTLLGLETLNNSGTLNANFGLTFDGGATALTNTGTINSAGTIDFGAGADSFANNGAGIFNLTGSTTLAGLETFTNSGRINLNANTLTLSGTPFVNGSTGFIDTSGNASILGITSFSNAGTLDLAAGTFTVPFVAFTNSGTILADEGASSIAGQASFANSGTIDLQDGAIGDVLTINSNYAGSGASNLLVDFSDTAADRLVINGAASGTTVVNANFVGAGLINVGGVLVVDPLTTSANAFTLGTVGGNTSPLIDYRLVQNGQDFFLTSAPNASAFDPLAVSNMAGSLWYQSADEVIAQTDLPSAAAGTGFWGQIYYSQDKYGDRNDVAVIDGTAFDVNNRLKTKRLGVQAGVDYGFGGARIGLTGGYGRAKADNDLNSSLKATGWNLGVYGQFGGTTGIHGSMLLKHDRYKLRFTNGAFDGERADLRATGVDGSLGYRFGLGESATLDAKVGLAHVRTKIDDINAFGFSYDIGRVTSTRGRAGLRATFGGNLAPYIDGTVYHEFNGNNNVRLFDGATFYDIDSRGKGTWARLEAGLAAVSGSGPILAAWADLGDKKGFGVRAGFRFGGRAVEEILPPPVAAPPPPPPPPATQTCYDGSVILATDICPSPPPPPPPPPPAPEPERG